MKEFIIERLKDFINNLTIYDYLVFGVLGLLFILFLILTILPRNPMLRLFMLLITILTLIVGPFGVKFGLDSIIRKTELNISETKRLTFANTLIVVGNIKNLGKIDYKECKITTTVIPKSESIYLKYFNMFLKPLYKSYDSIDLQGLPLKIDEDMDFRVSINNFTLTKDFEVDVRGSCY